MGPVTLPAMSPGVILALVVVGIVVAVAAVVIGVGIVIYNGLVRKKVQAENAWSQIDVQLKRRYDLIPNLVETVKGYATHERETFEDVIKARQAGIDASTIPEQAQAENMLSGALRRLFAVAEAYPELKANENFMQLQEELVTTENKIGFARQHYNDTVSRYNTAIETFPSNIVAAVTGFERREFFEIEEATHREAPAVKF